MRACGGLGKLARFHEDSADRTNGSPNDPRFSLAFMNGFAYMDGPVAAMFLIPQRPPKEIFVGNSVQLFSLVNWIKLPFFAWIAHW